MKIKRIITVVGTVAVLAALAGCSSTAATAPKAGSKEKPLVIMVSKGFVAQYWRAVDQGAQAAGKKYGMQVVFEGPESDKATAEQVDMLNEAITQKPAAIGFAALDSGTAGPAMAAAKAAGIPVIGFDSGVDSTVPVSTAATNNEAAAAEAAKHLAAALPNGGKVGILNFDNTSASGIGREKGFTDWIKAHAPNITLIPTVYVHNDPQQSIDGAVAMINGNPTLKGVYATGEPEAEGLAAAIKQVNKSGLVAVGFDSGAAQINAIKDGTLLGSITQNPVGIGYDTIETAWKLLNGKTVPKTIDTGFYWYDKSNLTDAKIAADLYQ